MKRSIGLWAAAGFLVGAAWVGLAFVFFTVPQSPTVEVIKLIASITCPPFLVTGLVTAPVVNVVLYGVVAFIWSRIRARLRSRAANRIGPAA